VENSVCLSHGVQVTGAIWQAVTRIMVGVADLVQRTRDSQEHVRYSVVGRSSGVVCGLHRAQGDEECEFIDLVSKPRATISWFGPQN
jgi:hypothetical protein